MNEELEARVMLLEALVKRLVDQVRFQDNQLQILETGFRSLLVRVHGYTDTNIEDVAWDSETLH